MDAKFKQNFTHYYMQVGAEQRETQQAWLQKLLIVGLRVAQHQPTIQCFTKRPQASPNSDIQYY